MPSFSREPNYEGRLSADGYDCRRYAWGSITYGELGHMYGNWNMWHFAADWQDLLFTNGAVSMTNVIKLMTNIAWWTLEPDFAKAYVTTGHGTYLAENYVTASATTNLLLAYFPDDNTITVDLSKFSGNVTSRWYDPVMGSFSTESGSPFTASGTHDFARSTNNLGGATDWVLLLEAASGEPPVEPPVTNVVNKVTLRGNQQWRGNIRIR